jgi:myo-inositol 2-dehydrogenase/D-chiro-inositol 1-dehydrogenase
MKVGILGAGRIGRVHARNIARFVPELEIQTIADPFLTPEAEAFARELGIPRVSRDPEDVFTDPEIEAVLICSSTNTHAEFICRAAKAGKHIFCEKPIDYDLARVRGAIDAARAAGVRLQIGFCRRFDHNHRAVYDLVRSGQVGRVNLIKISSRDPEPPSAAYVKVSGGIFCDMMIHDFDMARFLAGCEVTEVSACGSVLVDPAIGEAGDVDTAVVVLRFENGAIGVIDNSRRAVYGYDQRVEVFGDAGCAQDGNDAPNTAVLWNAAGSHGGTAYQVMWDRYTGAFVAELQAFARAVAAGEETPVTGEDGYYPVVMAAAAARSLREGRPVRLSEVAV